MYKKISGTSIMAQQVKLHHQHPNLSINPSPGCSASNPDPCKYTWENRQDRARTRAPANHIRNQDEIPGSWHQLGLALVISAIWDMNKWMEEPFSILCLSSLSLYNSVFKINGNKSLKKNRKAVFSKYAWLETRWPGIFNKSRFIFICQFWKHNLRFSFYSLFTFS